MKNVELIQELTAAAQAEAAKFANGNNSAGTRIRKMMQEIKVLAQKVRSDVQAAKNSES